MRASVFHGFLVTVWLVVFSTSVASAQIFEEGKWGPLSIPVDLRIGADGRVGRHTERISQDQARLAIELATGAGTPRGRLRVIDLDKNLMLVDYELASLQPGEMLLTPPLNARRIEILAFDAPAGAVIARLRGIIAPSLAPQPLGPVHNWERAGLFVDDVPWRPRMEAVVKLSFNGVHYLAPTCSGFLYKRPQWIVTNRHCIDESPAFARSLTPGRGRCDDVHVRFNYWDKNASSSPYSARCRTAVAHPSADVAVLVVEYSGAAPTSVLSPADKQPKAGEDLAMLHHPGGEPLVRSRCAFDPLDNPAGQPANVGIRHRCSTIGGSSGAPLLNQEGRIVAVHFYSEVGLELSVADLSTTFKSGNELLNRAIPREQLDELIARLP
jgi:Trypsin-like peptidase domain